MNWKALFVFRLSDGVQLWERGRADIDSRWNVHDCAKFLLQILKMVPGVVVVVMEGIAHDQQVHSH